MANLNIFEILLVGIISSQITIIVNNLLSKNKNLEKRLGNFFYRRTLFGFYNRDIMLSFIIAEAYIAIFIVVLNPFFQYGVYLELFIGFIGLIYILSKIIASEKEIKRITGNYYFFPPEGIYR